MDIKVNNNLISILRQNLDNLIRTGVLKDKYIVLFGMNTPGDEVINYLAQRNINVSAVIDNNTLNTGKKLAGVEVHLPEELLGNYSLDVIVLICSRYFSDMKKQLVQMGYDGDRQVYKVLEMNENSKYSTDEYTFNENVEYVKKGIYILKNIQKEYGENSHIIIAPIKANGDVYIISSMYKKYISEMQYENPVFAVVGAVCKKIAKMFDIESVITISQEEMEYLTAVSRFLGKKDSHIEVIQPYFSYTNIHSQLEGYKWLDFCDFFAYGYMNQDEKKKMENPVKRNEKIGSKDLENKMKELGIVEGNTYILAPYANSLPQIRWSFWIELANRLKEKGFTVLTNSASDEEMEVPGTEKIFFSIEDIVNVLEYAGGFIAMRNGLCEVASSAKCRQIVLYPDKAARHANIIAAYGIRAMGLNDKVIELIDSDELIEEVMNEIMEELSR